MPPEATVFSKSEAYKAEEGWIYLGSKVLCWLIDWVTVWLIFKCHIIEDWQSRYHIKDKISSCAWIPCEKECSFLMNVFTRIHVKMFACDKKDAVKWSITWISLEIDDVNFTRKILHWRDGSFHINPCEQFLVIFARVALTNSKNSTIQQLPSSTIIRPSSTIIRPWPNFHIQNQVTN